MNCISLTTVDFNAKENNCKSYKHPRSSQQSIWYMLSGSL